MKDRTLLAVRDLKAELAPKYVDIKSGLIVPSDTMDWDYGPLTLSRWYVETRADQAWVRESSYSGEAKRRTDT